MKSGSCIDENECRPGSNNCDANAICLNTIGSFTCTCNEGYYGTGKYCAPGQCHDGSCPVNQKCSKPTSIDCECKSGFIQVSSNICADIDECSDENDCAGEAKCLNTPGSYKCACKPGFVGNGKSCLEGQCSAEAFCEKNEECVSPTGTECKCKKGFVKNAAGRCSDVDD